MARQEEPRGEGSLGARTRHERRPCAYRACVPDVLAGRELLLPADLVADLADAERVVAALQDRNLGLANTEAVARLLLRANSAVDVLLAAEVLTQGTVGRRNRVFEASGLLDAIIGLERRHASPVGDTAIAAPSRAVPARRGGSPD